MNDMKTSLWSKNGTLNHECGSFKRNSSVAPFFFFLSLISIFVYFVASLALSLICPLWDLLMCLIFGILYLCPLWDICLTLRATLYILQGCRRSHTLQEVLNIKKTEN